MMSLITYGEKWIGEYEEEEERLCNINRNLLREGANWEQGLSQNSVR